VILATYPIVGAIPQQATGKRTDTVTKDNLLAYFDQEDGARIEDCKRHMKVPEVINSGKAWTFARLMGSLERKGLIIKLGDGSMKTVRSGSHVNQPSES
jgi:hypothetical protein